MDDLALMLDTPDSSEAFQRTAKRNTATARIEALLKDQIGLMPVWIRAPKSGAETYTGLTRSYLYQAAAQGLIRTVSIREPGKERGCRLFHLRSILEFIERHEQCGKKGVA